MIGAALIFQHPSFDPLLDVPIWFPISSDSLLQPSTSTSFLRVSCRLGSVEVAFPWFETPSPSPFTQIFLDIKIQFLDLVGLGGCLAFYLRYPYLD